MYDIKEKKQSEEENSITQMSCISDRSYFTKVQIENIMNLKSNYVPKENLFKIE